MSRFATLAVLCTLALCILSISLLAQDPAAGIQPFSTQINDAYTSVDVATDNVFLSIPVRNKDGKIPFSFKLVMNEHPYTIHDPLLPAFDWKLAFPRLSGQVMGAGPGIGLPTLTLCNSRVDPSLAAYLIVIDATGARHRTNNLPHILDTANLCFQNVFPQP
ncbi:MAG TPA: hypothetical protein VMS18_11545 [Candidatus Binatia bacterium]|nr:hypothetical protein [Candidatus Binatia bacterium]